MFNFYSCDSTYFVKILTLKAYKNCVFLLIMYSYYFLSAIVAIYQEYIEAYSHKNTILLTFIEKKKRKKLKIAKYF